MYIYIYILELLTRHPSVPVNKALEFTLHHFHHNLTVSDSKGEDKNLSMGE